MNLLSIDVGIKNLALCLFNIENKENYEILDWNVINLCNEEKINCICGKPAKYTYKNKIYCCKKHISNTEYNLIPKELEMKNLKKKKINDIKKILIENKIEFDKKKSKILLLEELETNLCEKYILPFSNNVKAKDMALVDIGISLKNWLDKLYNNIKIDEVIIENQISPIANRMKTIQGMIAQYFIMKDVIKIEFISASNKLKDYVGNQSTSYNERKNIGIDVCNEILINNEKIIKHLDMFCSHKKKDDLADCFLQGIWYIKEKLIY